MMGHNKLHHILTTTYIPTKTDTFSCIDSRITYHTQSGMTVLNSIFTFLFKQISKLYSPERLDNVSLMETTYFNRQLSQY